MKLSYISILALAIAVSACRNNPPAPKAELADTAETQAEAAAPAAPVDSAPATGEDQTAAPAKKLKLHVSRDLMLTDAQHEITVQFGKLIQQGKDIDTGMVQFLVDDAPYCKIALDHIGLLVMKADSSLETAEDEGLVLDFRCENVASKDGIPTQEELAEISDGALYLKAMN